MTRNSLDLRVRRTQKMLREAFIKLVIDQGFDNISVQMLADEAMINQATFYRHYEDKYDLAEKIYADLAAEYTASISDMVFEKPEDATRMLFEHVAQYVDFYKSMLATMPRFQGWVRKTCHSMWRYGIWLTHKSASLNGGWRQANKFRPKRWPSI